MCSMNARRGSCLASEGPNLEGPILQRKHPWLWEKGLVSVECVAERRCMYGGQSQMKDVVGMSVHLWIWQLLGHFTWAIFMWCGAWRLPLQWLLLEYLLARPSPEEPDNLWSEPGEEPKSAALSPCTAWGGPDMESVGCRWQLWRYWQRVRASCQQIFLKSWVLGPVWHTCWFWGKWGNERQSWDNILVLFIFLTFFLQVLCSTHGFTQRQTHTQISSALAFWLLCHFLTATYLLTAAYQNQNTY